jgi:hypothetical protein
MGTNQLRHELQKRLIKAQAEMGVAYIMLENTDDNTPPHEFRNAVLRIVNAEGVVIEIFSEMLTLDAEVEVILRDKLIELVPEFVLVPFFRELYGE